MTYRERLLRKVLGGLLQGMGGMWLFGAFVMFNIGVIELGLACVLLSIAAATLSAIVTP